MFNAPPYQKALPTTTKVIVAWDHTFYHRRNHLSNPHIAHLALTTPPTTTKLLPPPDIVFLLHSCFMFFFVFCYYNILLKFLSLIIFEREREMSWEIWEKEELLFCVWIFYYCCLLLPNSLGTRGWGFCFVDLILLPPVRLWVEVLKFQKPSLYLYTY